MKVSSLAQTVGITLILCCLYVTSGVLAQSEQEPSHTTLQQQTPVEANEKNGKDSKVSAGDRNKRHGVDKIYAAKSLPFCVLRAFERGLFWLHISNYTTTSVGTCTVKSIESLTAASAKAQMATLGAFDSVLVQGPYFQTMNVNKTQVVNPYISLGDLRFAEVGFSEFTLADVLKSPDKLLQFGEDGPYTSIRTTGGLNFIWFSGTQVYVITTDTGVQYVMTAVIHSIAFGQNGIRLSNLGRYLNLPEGWAFKAMRLKRVLSVNKNLLDTQFYRLDDEFGNIYLQLPTSIDLS